MTRLVLAVALLAVGLGATAAAVAGPVRSPAACEPLARGRALTLVSAATGAIDRGFPDLQGGGPNAVVSDGGRGWFVSGGTCVGGVHTRGLVHLHADGTLDGAWIPALPPDRNHVTGYADVTAMTVHGRSLVVGGSFGIAALDTRTGARRWRVPVAGRQGVFSLASSATAVYAGGAFSRIGGRAQPYLAAVSPTTGRLLPWHPAALGGATGAVPPHDVLAVALDGPRLFFGGLFTSIGGNRRPGFGAVSTTTGAVTPWLPGTARGYVKGAGVGDVGTIVIAHGQVMSAGHDGFGVTSDTNGAIVPWMNAVSGVAAQFATAGRFAYLAGDCRNSFDAVAGQPRNNLAAIDLTTRRFTAWAPNLAKYVCVSAIAANVDAVLVGGFAGRSLG